jgi:adenosyl cobinamide kinase/adenosyl cobinamide phosphate guanylyltransferase
VVDNASTDDSVDRMRTRFPEVQVITLDRNVGLAAADAEIDALIGAIGECDGDLIVVTNEVGWGVVPEHALARWFRDAAGRANQHMASVSDEVWLLVAGIPVRISP